MRWLSRCRTLQEIDQSYSVKYLSAQLGVIRPSLGQTSCTSILSLKSTALINIETDRLSPMLSHAQVCCRHACCGRLLLWQLQTNSRLDCHICSPVDVPVWSDAGILGWLILRTVQFAACECPCLECCRDFGLADIVHCSFCSSLMSLFGVTQGFWTG